MPFLEKPLNKPLSPIFKDHIYPTTNSILPQALEMVHKEILYPGFTKCFSYKFPKQLY